MPALFGLGVLLLLPKLVSHLWPNSPSSWLASFILLGSFFFAAKIPMMHFDVLTTFLVLLSIYSMVLSIEKNNKYGYLFAGSLALALLTKDPVVFLFGFHFGSPFTDFV